MLFFKPKRKEIIPPPSPDFEEQVRERPKFFDELIKKPKPETFTEEDEFNRLVKELNEGLKPLSKEIQTIPGEKTSIKSGKNIVSRQLKKEAGKRKPLKKRIKKTKKIMKRKMQPRRLMKTSIKHAKKQKSSLPENRFDLEKLGLGIPKEFQQAEIELPETLGGSDIEREVGQKKPKEILDAEEEIQSAIEKIRIQQSPLILKRLFSKKQKTYPGEKNLMYGFPAADVISRIQSNINDARQALMKFDLEAARKSYIEAMRLYNNMPSEERAKVYHDIKELYFERKSAEELRV